MTKALTLLFCALCFSVTQLNKKKPACVTFLFLVPRMCEGEKRKLVIPSELGQYITLCLLTGRLSVFSHVYRELFESESSEMFAFYWSRKLVNLNTLYGSSINRWTSYFFLIRKMVVSEEEVYSLMLMDNVWINWTCLFI